MTVLTQEKNSASWDTSPLPHPTLNTKIHHCYSKETVRQIQYLDPNHKTTKNLKIPSHTHAPTKWLWSPPNRTIHPLHHPMHLQELGGGSASLLLTVSAVEGEKDSPSSASCETEPHPSSLAPRQPPNDSQAELNIFIPLNTI